MAQARTALVTGANRGIGLEVVRQLAGRGYRVLLGSRDPERGARAAAGLAEPVTVVALDVADPDATARLAAEHGDVDILVNNAGIHYDTTNRALEPDWRIVDEALRTNLLGAWRLAAAFAPGMRARRWGRIVNVSSGAGALSAMAGGTPAYSVTKAGLNVVTIKLAAELRGSGVLVNAVCPGWVNTDMGQGGRPVAEGAAGVVWAATLPDGGPSGGFFRDGRPIPW
jgi:NAD(P)-dependent dehydrogenase (short-subunit alcohol dehydrogenase family)